MRRRPLIRPAPLHDGARVGVFSPSDPADVVAPVHWRRAVEWFERRGHPVVTGTHAFVRRGRRPAAAEDRVADLHRLCTDPAIGAVFASVGGSHAHQMLTEIDYARLAARPTILVGYSDATALTVALHVRTGLVTFYGPVFATFAQPELPATTVDGLFAVATGARVPLELAPAPRWADDRWYAQPAGTPRPWRANPGWRTLRGGVAEGWVLGAEMSTLLLLAGTEFAPDPTGAVLFLEAADTHTPATVERCLTQLRQLGFLRRIAGLVLGRFPSAVFAPGDQELAAIVAEATRGGRFPILADVDFGHTDPSFTLPTGVRCAVDADAPRLALLEPAVGDLRD